MKNKLLAITMILALLFTVIPFIAKANGASCYIRGFWHFDEGVGSLAYDVSGYDNHGAICGGAIWADGKFGKALDFDGIDSYVDVPDSPSLDITGKITLEAWIYPRSMTQQVIVAKYNHSSLSSSYYLGLGGYGYMNKILFALSYNGNNFYYMLSNTNITENMWTHVAATSNATHMALYINGIKDNVRTYPPGVIYAGTANLRIGCYLPEQGFPRFFDGIIDEVRVSAGVIWTVDDDRIQCPNADSTTIQEAIDEAAPGDTIIVHEGTYSENLVISKSLTIQGVDKNTTIIQAQPVGYGDKAIEIQVNCVTISGFTLSGYAATEEKPGSTYWGVYAYGTSSSRYSNIAVTDNIFTFLSQGGIRLGYVDESLIKDNIFKTETRLVWYKPPGATPGSYINVTRGGAGPELWYCTNIVIDPNVIETSGVGIFLYNSNNVLIEANIISAPDTATPSDKGIHVQSCTDINIVGNTILNFTAGPKSGYNYGTDGAGINIIASNRINIQNNNLHNNTIGVLVERLDLVDEPREVDINDNNFENNTEFGVLNCYTWVGKDKTYTPTNASYVVDACYNWWGHETGPYHGTSWEYMGEPYGPHYGLGDNVSDYVLYEPWLLAPWPEPPATYVHDVAVIQLTATPTTVEIGNVVYISVAVKNLGNATETFTLITNYGSYEQVETITDLSPEAEVAFNYEWDTSGEETCFHTIVALASPVSGETKIHNNGRSATIRLVSYIPEPALLRVEPDYKKGVVGGSIEVNVTVNDLDAYWDLAAFDVKLYYNTAILDVADIELGEFAYRFNMTYQFIKGINEAEGYVHLAYIWNFVELPPEARPTPYDHGVLFTIRFVIKESGTCTLELKDIDLAAFPNATKWCALGSEAITTIAQDGSVEAVPRHLADLNSDGKVDIYDVVLAVEAYGSMLGDPNWNEDADIAEPYGVINIFDIVTICSYYGLTYA